MNDAARIFSYLIVFLVGAIVNNIVRDNKEFQTYLDSMVKLEANTKLNPSIAEPQRYNGFLIPSPITFIFPEKAQAVEPKNESTSSSKPQISITVKELMKRIEFLESSNGTRGLAVTCKNKGMVNNWGFLPKPGFCFDTYESGYEHVSGYLERKLAEFNQNVEVTLCYYNQGKPNGVLLSSCWYSDTILGVK